MARRARSSLLSEPGVALSGHRRTCLASSTALNLFLALLLVQRCNAGSGAQSLGAIDIGEKDPKFEPPTLLEAEKPRFRFEHGTAPGMEDEQLAERAERLEARGEWPPPPPKWQTQLKMKLRVAQEGRYWEKSGPGNTGPLGIERDKPLVHQERIWDSVCDQMEVLMDKGCGHHTKNFEQGRKEIYETMKLQDERRNGRDILDKIERNKRQAAEEAERTRLKKLEDGETGSEDSSEERTLQEVRERRREELRRAERGMGQLATVTADTFLQQVVHAGDVWVVLHVYDDGRQDCEIVDSVLSSMARSHGKVVKFVKVHFRHILPDLDQVTELPQIMFYRKGDIKHHVTGLLELGSASVGVEGRIVIRKDAESHDPAKQIHKALEQMLVELKALGPKFGNHTPQPADGRGATPLLAKAVTDALSDDDVSSSDSKDTSSLELSM